jgi:hypothetical protein
MSATVTAGQLAAQAVFPKENSSKTEVAATLAPANTVFKVIGYRISFSFDKRITRDFTATQFVQRCSFHKLTVWPWRPDSRQVNDKAFSSWCPDIRPADHKQETILPSPLIG